MGLWGGEKSHRFFLDLCITTLDYDSFIQVNLFLVVASGLEVTMVTEVVCRRCYQSNTSSFSGVPLDLHFYTPTSNDTFCHCNLHIYMYTHTHIYRRVREWHSLYKLWTSGRHVCGCWSVCHYCPLLEKMGKKDFFPPFRSRWNLNKFHGRNTFSYMLLKTWTATFKSHVKPQIIIICD